MFWQNKTVRALWSLLWSSTKSAPFFITLSLFFLVLSRLMALGVPLLYKQIVDKIGIQSFDPAVILFLIAAYGLIRLASTAFSELRDIIFAPIEQKAIRLLSRNVFAHLHTLDMQFHLNRKTGELTRILERGGRAIENFFRFAIFSLLPTFLELGLIIGVLFYLYTWTFGAIVLATLFAYIFFTFKISAWRLGFMRSMNSAHNDLGGNVVDSLLNAATVKYFCNEALEIQRYDRFLHHYEHSALLNKRSLALLNFGQGVILTAGIVAVMWAALPDLKTNSLSVGDFVLLNTYLLQVYAPLYILGFAYRELKQALVDMEGLFGLLNTTPSHKAIENAPPLNMPQGHIEFKNVSFAYNGRTILDNISLEILPGQTVAIVGASGSGKSTLTNLLLHLFTPNKGKILIDSQNIQNVSEKSLRAHIAIVPQDTVLFNDTLAYNIAYGAPGASQKEIEDASKQAELHTFILSLPEGYNTPVGERGLKLSGGEKQRLSIARAVLKKPKAFIFDEATSSLDTQTEKKIQKSLLNCAKGYTTLIVAHRLSTIQHADQIVVLDQGKIIERGHHKELLKIKGIYATLWKKQGTLSSSHSEAGS